MSASATTLTPTPADAQAAWRGDNAEWLALRLEWLRLRLNRRALWLQRPRPDDRRAADWLIAVEGAELEQRFYATDPSAAAIDRLIAAAEQQLADQERRMDEGPRPPALRVLSELTGLSGLEEAILLLALAPAIDGTFARAYAELHDDSRRDYATLHLALGVFLDGAANRVLAADSLAPSRPLRALRLIDIDDASDEPLLTRRLGVDERMVDYLRGLNRADSRVLSVLSDLRPAHLSEGAEQTAASVAALVDAETARWPTVNLVGDADGGAGDVAARACELLGLRLRALDIERLTALPLPDRAALLTLLGREALLGGFGLLIDTSGIERGSAAAAVVDEVIQRVAATLFVVSAERWPTDMDAHVVPVSRPSRAEQGGLWRAALAAHASSVNGELEAITQQFDFGPQAIAAAVERAGRRSGGEIDGKELWRSCREQNGAAIEELAQRITPGYGWEDIVVADDVRAQLQEIAGQVENRGRVYEAWGFGA
ncbi:MAG TPA: hypothetical protein VFW96_01845, partial [Thermomicrobiales bacterium]|nr:hypothetical protein [Thermomicrobiales bacterium]